MSLVVKLYDSPALGLAHAVATLGKEGAPIDYLVILVILVETNKTRKPDQVEVNEDKADLVCSSSAGKQVARGQKVGNTFQLTTDPALW